MPDYQALFNQGIYSLATTSAVFAGTVDDPFFIDLGAAFDSLNFRMGVGGVLPASRRCRRHAQLRSRRGRRLQRQLHRARSSHHHADRRRQNSSRRRQAGRDRNLRHHLAASRSPCGVRRSESRISGRFQQVQREGNPLINELIIGTGSKDRFSMDDPKNDAQFANFVLNPLLAHGLRLDRHSGRSCAAHRPADPGAVPGADLSRLRSGRRWARRRSASPEHGHSSHAVGSQKRLGFLAGDIAGFPNGRRPIDDVVDIASRAVAGILVDSTKYGTAIGDGVQFNPEGYGIRSPT